MSNIQQYSLLRIFWDNLKTEIALLIVSIIIFFIDRHYSLINFFALKAYLSDERVNLLVEFISISTGVYIAIIAIFSTATTNTSEKIIEKNLDTSLIVSTCTGLIENIIVILLFVFLLDFWNAFYFWAIVLTCMSIISFCKFILFIIITYKYNLSTLAVQIDKQENYKGDILSLLEEIKRNTTK